MASTPLKVGFASAAVFALAAGLIIPREGLRYKAYADPATGGAPWTICYGHTGRDVVPGRVATLAQCKALLRLDMEEASARVFVCTDRRPMPNGVRAALISLTFNVGPRAVCQGSPGRYARAGDWLGVCRSLAAYKYANGRVFNALVVSRKNETRVCMEGL